MSLINDPVSFVITIFSFIYLVLAYFSNKLSIISLAKNWKVYSKNDKSLIILSDCIFLFVFILFMKPIIENTNIGGGYLFSSIFVNLLLISSIIFKRFFAKQIEEDYKVLIQEKLLSSLRVLTFILTMRLLDYGAMAMNETFFWYSVLYLVAFMLIYRQYWKKLKKSYK